MKPIRDLRAFLRLLRARGDLAEVTVPVDPRLEIAEIHRRTIARGGPALLFRSPRGADFPVVTNLFGTQARVDLAFGSRPKEFIERVVHAAETLLPPTPGKLWGFRDLLAPALAVGMRRVADGPVCEVAEEPRLDRMPALTSWAGDGGPFLTLPLVYTEHPESRKPNLGMYRMHVHGPSETGMHFQIHKGGGFHFHAAERTGRNLPATVFLGGPPAMVLAAIAPLPEDVPELLLASLVLGERLPRVAGKAQHPLVAGCEFAIEGEVVAGVRRREGPFGDHYGYDSFAEDFPVFRARRVFRRRDAIFPATVVGPPKQEDFFIGDHLQDLLSPLFPLVMPSVRKLWSYGDTGFHPLAAAVVRDRYPREAVVSGFRILGEGQLSLTKFVMLTDQDVDVRDFRSVLETVLARVDWATDLVIVGVTAQDSLDYTGPATHRGSKAMLLGLGAPKRSPPDRWIEGSPLPQGVRAARAFCRGCLVVEGDDYAKEKTQAARIAQFPGFREWPLVVLVDDAKDAASSAARFLWTTFTRMEPAADVHARASRVERFHVALDPPVVWDCRMKPWYPPVLETDVATRELVDRRWAEYGVA